MKLLTLNFLTCAIKSCKTSPASFPLHPREAELEIVETDINLPFLKNILPRLMWEEIRVIASEVRTHHRILSLPLLLLLSTKDICSLSSTTHTNEKQTKARSPRPPHHSTHARRPGRELIPSNRDLGERRSRSRRNSQSNGKRPAPHPARDGNQGGKAGVWKLRA